jgi:hypothetical protein
MNGGNSTLKKSVVNISFLTVNDANISDKYIEQSSLYHPSIWAWGHYFRVGGGLLFLEGGSQKIRL